MRETERQKEIFQPLTQQRGLGRSEARNQQLHLRLTVRWQELISGSLAENWIGKE